MLCSPSKGLRTVIHLTLGPITSNDDGDARAPVSAVSPLESPGSGRDLHRYLLALLRVRRLYVSDDVRQRIKACTDFALLDRWLVRASTANLAEDISGAP